VVLLVVVRSRFARCRVQPAVGAVRRSRARCPLRWCGRLGRTRSAAAEQLVPRGLESDCLGDAVPTLTCIVSHHSVDRLRHLHRTSSYSFATRQILGMQTEQAVALAAARRYAPADGSSTVAKIAADLHPSADGSAVCTSLMAGGA